MRKYFEETNRYFRLKEDEFIDSCPVCGEIPDILCIDRCPTCDLVWNNPQPTEKALEEFYRKSAPMKLWSEIKSSPEEEKRQREKYKFFNEFIVNNKIRKVLDVGSGNGFFLTHLPKDIGAAGIEPNIDAAKQSFNIPIFADYEEFKSTGINPQMITMFGVLEHLKKPGEEIERYAGLLPDDGYFGIIVPNHNSLVVQTLGHECSTFCPQHLWHFNIDSLKYLFEKHGFRLVTWSTVEAELQPILREIKGIPPYTKMFDLKDDEITERKILEGNLGYKIQAIFMRGNQWKSTSLS